MSTRVDAFVVAVPGLEPFVMHEVQRLGVRPARPVTGGVECTVTWPQLWSLHLHSRVATRVLVRVTSFHADGFNSLRRGVTAVDWASWLPGGAIHVAATCDKRSKLYHSAAVAERVAECLPGGTTERVDQQLHVRVMRNQVTLSLDASGAPLHHRAWRSTGGKAPLRATMAAALLSASGWDARRPLVDPFCGSGTIAVEAAMIARRIAPGAERTFAWQRWSSFDAAAWQRQLDAAAANVLARCPPVVATDRDAGAVRTTRAHAQRAGVDQQVEVRQASISEMLLPPRPGWVVTNPPYGRRLGDDVRNVYAAFGSALRAGSGWNVAVIVPRDAPLAQMRVPFEVVGSTTHGGLRVDFRRSAPEPAADTVMV